MKNQVKVKGKYKSINPDKKRRTGVKLGEVAIVKKKSKT